MKNKFYIAVILSLLLIFKAEYVSAQQSQHQTFRAVPFTDVHFDDNFWSPRVKTNREISIPHNYQWCESTGRISNFAKAAKLVDGEFKGIYFNDSDVYKVLEGTAYSLADHPDPELEKQADDVIAKIAAAQQPNGYLNTYFILEPKDQNNKWTKYQMHELYCAGHLFEGAVAYKQVTGKDALLNVAEKFADHIIDVFITQKTSTFEVPGCEVIELALVKLYQQTGKEKYLTLSKHFIDVRGDQSKRRDKLQGIYSQDHQPIREQSEIVGHAVRAAYLYSGATDIAALTNDKSLIDAMERLWDNTVNKKMYITGGIGSRHEGESFGDNYELPNKTAYGETCAAISLVFWAHRMNLMTGDAKYADVIERVIYNGMLPGVGLDGTLFLYVNPLEADKIQSTVHDVVKNNNHHRQPFFETACCPTNIIRFLPSLPGYVYATEGNTIIVNQFVAGKATVKLPDDEVEITQETYYPWDGKVELTLNKPATLKVRNGDKYDTFTGQTKVVIDRKLEAKRMIANPQVVADRGRVAIQRGPVVYCFEECDNEVPVTSIRLAHNPQFMEEFRKDLLGGIVVLKCKNADGRELTAVPYYAWDNREMGAMTVWVRQQGLSESKPVETGTALYKELKPEMLCSDEEL
jgi:DUF1680 family protein